MKSPAPQLWNQWGLAQLSRMQIQGQDDAVQRPPMGRLVAPKVGYFLPPPRSLPAPKGGRGYGQQNLRWTTPTKAPRNDAFNSGCTGRPTRFSSPLRRELQLGNDDSSPGTQESVEPLITVKLSPRSKQKAVHRKQPDSLAMQQDNSDESNFGDSQGFWDDADITSSSSGNDDSDDEDYRP